MTEEEIEKKLRELTTIINPLSVELCKDQLLNNYNDFMMRFVFFNMLTLLFGDLTKPKLKKELCRIVDAFGDEARVNISHNLESGLENMEKIKDRLAELEVDEKTFIEKNRQTIEKSLKEFLNERKEEMDEWANDFIKFKEKKIGGKK